MDRIEKAKITSDWFEKDKDFDLEAYAGRSFGSFHSDEEFTRVVWRFSPVAAATAREFEFHPKQEMTDLGDGGLMVSFEASGLVEMAWHLAKWEREVEVVEPVALRKMAVEYREVSVRVLPSCVVPSNKCCRGEPDCCFTIPNDGKASFSVVRCNDKPQFSENKGQSWTEKQSFLWYTLHFESWKLQVREK
jgi:hypothetical protein